MTVPDPRFRDQLAAAGVDPAEIARQRTLGWPDFHPEDYCHRCGRPNPNWFADTEVWQTATGSTGDGGGILCPPCLCSLWEQVTGKTAVIWRLSIDPRSRDARGRDTAGMREAPDPHFRDQLAGVLLLGSGGRQYWDPEELRDIVDDLLPVVQHLAVEKAAEELRAAADASEFLGRPLSPQSLRARAAVLASPAPAPQTGEGQR